MSKASITLQKYLPAGSDELTLALLRTAPIELRISKPRKTKLGDYRFPTKGNRHRISINANLNPYAFLITLIHEVAHLKAFEDFGKGIKPHGEEWQHTFRVLAKPFLAADIFPNDIANTLITSLNKGRASSCTDLELYRTLKKYDTPLEDHLTVEMVEHGKLFQINGDKIFKKGPKLRKRYKCVNVANGREYMVHALAEVKIIENPNHIKSA